MRTEPRIRRQPAATSRWSSTRPAEGGEHAVLPGLPAGYHRPGVDPEPGRAHRLPDVHVRVPHHQDVLAPSTGRRRRAHPSRLVPLLRAFHQVVDQDAEAPSGARGQVADGVGEVVHAVQHLDHDALDPQVVAPDSLDQLGVVAALDEDPRPTSRPRPQPVDGARAGRRAGLLRAGRRQPGRDRGDEAHRASVDPEPGAEREGAGDAVPVLEHHQMDAPALLGAQYRPAPAGLDVLDDDTHVGGHGRHPTPHPT